MGKKIFKNLLMKYQNLIKQIIVSTVINFCKYTTKQMNNFNKNLNLCKNK